jgi:hypothetical protein
MVIVSLMDNSIQLIDEQISSLDKDKMQYYQQVVQGKEKASIKGSAVFKYLKKAVLANKLGTQFRDSGFRAQRLTSNLG